MVEGDAFKIAGAAARTLPPQAFKNTMSEHLKWIGGFVLGVRVV